MDVRTIRRRRQERRIRIEGVLTTLKSIQSWADRAKARTIYSEGWRKDADFDAFWALVDLARTDHPAFVAKLRAADRRELIRFEWIFVEMASALGREPYRRFTDPTLSEDARDDLWEAVVGRGRAFYEDVLAHPERMPREVDSDDVSHRMRYEASNVFFERFGEEIPPHSYDY